MGSNSRLRGDSPERGHRARRVPARVNAGFGRPRRVVCGRRSCMLPLGSGCQGHPGGAGHSGGRVVRSREPPPQDPVVASETPGERSPRRASAEPAAATRWRQSAAQRGRDRGCRCRGRRGAAGRAVPTPRGGSSPTRDACQCQADAGQGRERRAGTRRGCWARTRPGRAEGRQGAKAGPRAASAAGELVLSGASGTALRRR